MHKNLKGFTLIELLIVIAIIGILAVAFLPTLLGAPAKGRDAQRISDLQKIQKVLISGNLVGKTYPDTGCVTPELLDATDFGGAVPKDPQADNTFVVKDINKKCTGQYAYVAAPKGYQFGLYAKLENATSGNVSCDKLRTDGALAIATPPADDTDSCYYILTN